MKKITHNEGGKLPYCPLFDGNTIGQLTQILLDMLKPVTDNPQQYPAKASDILLMSNLTSLSTLFGNVSLPYNGKLHSLNIAYVLMSDAGTNKSVMTFANAVTNNVDDFLRRKFKEKHDEWEADNLKWEQELARAKKAKDEPDFSLKPGDEPQFMLMNMPTTTSKSQLTLTMQACQDHGLLLSSTEINSLVDIMGKDYGDFADMLCKAIVNEKVDHFFKVDGKPIVVKRPMISILISGTEDQYHKLFPTLSDGLFSRFFHHKGDADDGWLDQRPSENADKHRQLLKDISQDCFYMWQWQRSFEEGIKVVFTDEQWDRHTSFWSKVYDEFITECDIKFAAIPKRHGFMQMRVAAVLAMMRKWDSIRTGYLASYNVDSADSVVTCSDTDFAIAEHITYTLYQHAVAISTTKKEPVLDINEMHDWRWSDDALSKVVELYGEESFSRQDFVDVAMQDPWRKSQSTAYRTLSGLESQKKVKRVKRSKPTRYVVAKSYLRKLCK